MDNEVSTLILQEVRDLRQEMRDTRSDVARLAQGTESRLTACESSLKPLIDNGRPGLISVIREDVAKLKQWKWYLAGLCAGLSLAANAVFKAAELMLK